MPRLLVENFKDAQPFYKTVPGWKTAKDHCKTIEDLSVLVQRYLEHLEELWQAPLPTILAGLEQEATMQRKV
jgi:adenylosuccinate synthase